VSDPTSARSPPEGTPPASPAPLGAAAEGDAPPPHGWRRWLEHPRLRPWQWTAYPLALFAITRLALMLFSSQALMLVPGLDVKAGPRYEFMYRYPALDGLFRWDTGFFLRIARDGYFDIQSTNFFPLYPLLARGLHELTGIHLHVSLLVVSNLACLAAYLVIYRMFVELEGEAPARWALAIFVAHPFAFFHSAAYPESLMILFTALSLRFAMKGQHLRAGAALGLGVLARHISMLAGAGLVVAHVRQRGWNVRRLLFTPAVLGLLLPWAALGAYCLYLNKAFGSPFTFWSARTLWGPSAYWGITDLVRAWNAPANPTIMKSYLPSAAFVSVGGILLLTKERWRELAGFSTALLVMLWAIGMYGLGRYSASCWPAMLPLGVWLSKRPMLQGPVIAVLALFQGMFFYLFAHQFPIL